MQWLDWTWRIWDALAKAAGLRLSSHFYPMVSAQLLRVSESADWLEWTTWAGPLLAEPLPVQDGFALVPDKPANGLQWDEGAVRRFSL